MPSPPAENGVVIGGAVGPNKKSFDEGEGDQASPEIVGEDEESHSFSIEEGGSSMNHNSHPRESSMLNTTESNSNSAEAK